MPFQLSFTLVSHNVDNSAIEAWVELGEMIFFLM